MPGEGYLPRADHALMTWSLNLSTRIGASPAIYGLSPQQASDYAALQTAYTAAYNTANQDATRTKPTIIAKNIAKQALVASTRELVEIIQAFPGTTDEMRGELQITIRTYQPTPSPIPANSPIFHIDRVTGYKVWYTLREPNSDSRGKPNAVIGAQLLAFVGDAPPSNPAEWQLLGLVTRTKSHIILPSAMYPAGSRIWLSASWVNPKGQTGPMSDPISCFISTGLSNAA